MFQKKILAVGGDGSLLTLISILFAAKGCEVQGVADNKSALDAINKDHPDLILIDVELPRARGLDLCRYVKSNSLTQHITVIILDTDQSKKGRWKEAGADHYLTKPFRSSELTNSVLRIMGE